MSDQACIVRQLKSWIPKVFIIRITFITMYLFTIYRNFCTRGWDISSQLKNKEKRRVFALYMINQESADEALIQILMTNVGHNFISLKMQRKQTYKGSWPVEITNYYPIKYFTYRPTVFFIFDCLVNLFNICAHVTHASLITSEQIYTNMLEFILLIKQ